MGKINAAVVGCGNIGTYAHIPNLKSMPNVELVSVCDIVEEKAEAASRQYKVGRHDTDYRRIISDSDIGLVAICTPPDTHLEIASAALEAGKHVFLEKPLAANLLDSVKLYKITKGSRSKLMPGFCLRYHGMFKYVKHLIEQGKVGTPALMWRNAIGAAIGVLAPAQWVMQKRRSGGMLVENTMHIFDAFRWFAGEYDSVYAETRTVSKGVDIEDTAIVGMKFECGAYATITQTWAATHSWDTMYRKELESFVQSILGNADPEVDVTDALKAMEAATAALRSSDEKEPIKLPLVSY